MSKRDVLLKRFIVVMAAVIIVVIIVIMAMQNWLVGKPKELAKQTANIYAFGDGTNMKELIAPGYVEYFEKDSQVLGVNDMQDIYIDKFRSFVEEKVGDIEDVDCKVTDVMAVSNIKDFEQDFADRGVTGVSEYRRVEAEWLVTGGSGEYTMSIEMYVLKCDDGWYVDYVQLPEEVEEAEDETAETSEDATVEDTQTDSDTTEADAETTDEEAEAD